MTVGNAFSGRCRWTCTLDSKEEGGPPSSFLLPPHSHVPDFLTFLRLGLSHIADPKAYDHILFITALTVAYPTSAWRQLLGLITAFTLGHSLTLALATLELVRVNAAVVEVLIPLTIVMSSILAIAAVRSSDTSAVRRNHMWRYALVAVFGLVHGLGFSTFLRAILGGEESIALPLFAFNVGLEVGQLAIVAGVLALGALAHRALRVERRDWVLVLSGATAGVAVVMVVERLSW